MSSRFSRVELLFGAEKMERLRKACVTVVGLGAVGSYAVEALARAGVGNLRVVDFDVVRESNVNRQLLALTSTIGRYKADLAASRIHDINPNCRVEALRVFADAETSEGLLSPRPDALVDAIDSVSCKAALLTVAARAGVFTLSAMGAATRLDPFKVKVKDISKSETCPLAREIRKRLRKAGISTGIRCVYSEETLRAKAIADPGVEKDFFERGRRRRTLGSVSYMTGLFGLIAAGEVIRNITGE
ncbi:MAG: tRNA threonylcarbamoyladenosine dehydratase [Fibrobacterota bacterium]